MWIETQTRLATHATLRLQSATAHVFGEPNGNYRFTINGVASTKHFDTLEAAKRVAVASLQNKMTHDLQVLRSLASTKSV
jgi:hypothetical protein